MALWMRVVGARKVAVPHTLCGALLLLISLAGVMLWAHTSGGFLRGIHTEGCVFSAFVFVLLVLLCLV